MVTRTDVHRDIYDPRASATDREVAVLARNGMVVALQPLAAQAGLGVLRQGGNAVDAAVAVAAVLGVVEPCMSGPMGAGYMLIARGDDVACLDFCGPTPAATATAHATARDLVDGPRACLVPGAVAGWFEALRRFGTLDGPTVLAPAIDYAAGGFAVTPKLARWFERSADRLSACPFARSIFLREGRVPAAGEVLRQPGLAETFRVIAHDGADAFYRGVIASRIADYMRDNGGWLAEADLGTYTPAWQPPLAASFDGWQVFTPPPPSSGIQLVQTLSILDGLAFEGPFGAEFLHVLIEAIKLARADRIAALVGPERRLSAEYTTELQQRIDPRRAAPSEGDRFAAASAFTTAFCVADADGTLVVCTQSLGQLFGAATVAGDTGLLLNDFLWWFDDDLASPNHLAPDKKLDMCLAPSLSVAPDGKCLALATPGSNGIAQTTAQMLANVVRFGLPPQAALEAPRLVSFGRHPFIDPWGAPRAPTLVAIEVRVPQATRGELERRGHVLEDLESWSNTVGSGVAILRHADGVLEGGADPRRDSQACGW
jgi:gamma-glutamyltranspeptidase / glutathione hydrolase